LREREEGEEEGGRGGGETEWPTRGSGENLFNSMEPDQAMREVSSTWRSAVTRPTLPPPHTTRLPLGRIAVQCPVLLGVRGSG
jgi:hypothetical protein